MRKSVKAAIAIGAALVVLTIVFIAIIFSTINKMQNADFYTMGSERVPSIKSVVGERNIRGFNLNINDEATTKSYRYKSKTGDEDLKQYEDYLVNQADFIITKSSPDDYNHFYARESADAGKLILVYIEAGKSVYKITVQKRAGVLQMNQ